MKAYHGITIVAGSILAGISVFNLPAVRRYLSPSSEGVSIQYDHRNDPAVSSEFPVPFTDAFGKPIVRTQQTVVVIAGSCSSCALNSIDPRKVVPLPGQTLVFVYEMKPSELPSWTKALKGAVRVATDPDSSLSKKANAIWKPRYVQLDERSRVLSISDNLSGRPNYVKTKG